MRKKAPNYLFNEDDVLESAGICFELAIYSCVSHPFKQEY